MFPDLVEDECTQMCYRMNASDVVHGGFLNLKSALRLLLSVYRCGVCSTTIDFSTIAVDAISARALSRNFFGMQIEL